MSQHRQIIFPLAEELDELEKMVVPLFENIQNRKAKKFTYTEENHPWPRNRLGCKVYIMPLETDTHTLYLTFPVPDASAKYKTAVSAPFQYLHVQNTKSIALIHHLLAWLVCQRSAGLRRTRQQSAILTRENRPWDRNSS